MCIHTVPLLLFPEYIYSIFKYVHIHTYISIYGLSPTVLTLKAKAKVPSWLQPFRRITSSPFWGFVLQRIQNMGVAMTGPRKGLLISEGAKLERVSTNQNNGTPYNFLIHERSLMVIVLVNARSSLIPLESQIDHRLALNQPEIWPLGRLVSSTSVRWDPVGFIQVIQVWTTPPHTWRISSSWP